MQNSTWSSKSYAHDLGQSFLEIYTVPKENDTVQQMTQSTTGFIVFWVQAVILLVLSCFPSAGKGDCTLLCAFPWPRSILTVITLSWYVPHMIFLEKKSPKSVNAGKGTPSSSANKTPALLPTFCSRK